MKILIGFAVSVGLLGTLSWSFAQNQIPKLSPTPTAPEIRVPSAEKSEWACNEISGALQEYNQLARGHENAIAEFVVEVNNIMFNWYEILRPFEDTTVSIPEGTFSPIDLGATQVGEVVGLVYENSNLLDQRMQVIMTSLRKCL